MKQFFVPEKQLWKLRVKWWNIGHCHDPWCMNLSQNIEISRERQADWLHLGFNRGPKPQFTEWRYDRVG